MKPFKILLFIASAIAMLTLIAIVFPKDGLRVAGMELHFPTVEKIIVPKEELDLQAFLEQQALRDAENQRILQGLQDTVDFYRRRMEEGELRFWFPQDDADFVMPFFDLLATAESEGRTVRILHYGDSQLEMDRLTNRLRAYMQQTFGGGGPGMLNFQPVIRSLSVVHSASGSLDHRAPYGETERNDGHYGPLMNVHILDGEATARFSATSSRGADSALMRFSSFKLLLNNHGDSLSCTATARGIHNATQTCSRHGVQCLSWHTDSAVPLFTLTVTGHADLYGMMVDNGPGVAVDNIPMRGCSGQQFTMVNAAELAEAYSKMDVALIILQFGGNSVPYIKGEKALATYAASIGKQIDRVRQTCPQAQVLFIGPSDMSTTVNGEYVTYPYLPNIVDGLRDSVLAHGAAFWSLYDAMGGKNSMPVWVDKGLAGPDYIHYSQKGADIMGDRIARAFSIAYDYYLVRKRQDEQRAAIEADTLSAASITNTQHQ
ncbi:MAG: hypothetical protein IJ620_03995 [Bacteroidales bacterium]|nr:hypothetical protein [Bacteroidales bacterium]